MSIRRQMIKFLATGTAPQVRSAILQTHMDYFPNAFLGADRYTTPLRVDKLVF